MGIFFLFQPPYRHVLRIFNTVLVKCFKKTCSYNHILVLWIKRYKYCVLGLTTCSQFKKGEPGGRGAAP